MWPAVAAEEHLSCIDALQQARRPLERLVKDDYEEEEAEEERTGNNNLRQRINRTGRRGGGGLAHKQVHNIICLFSDAN